MPTETTFLVPAFNAMPHIRHAVKSMQKQTNKDFHAIIINDGSSDGTHDYLESIRDSRFKIIHQENRGYIAALNSGAKLVQTPYFSRLDADDLAMPQRLCKQIEFLNENPKVAVVGSRSNYIFLSKNEFCIPLLFKCIRPGVSPPMRNPPFWNPIDDGHNITHPSVTIRKSAFEAVGGYRNLAPSEDYDLWIRLHDAGFLLACLPEVLCLYRVGTSSVSSQSYLKSIHVVHYARFCHNCRISGLPEPEFEEYAVAHPLSQEIQSSAELKLRLRNTMGCILAGHLFSGGFKLAKLLFYNHRFFIAKMKSRCS